MEGSEVPSPIGFPTDVSDDNCLRTEIVNGSEIEELLARTHLESDMPVVVCNGPINGGSKTRLGVVMVDRTSGKASAMPLKLTPEGDIELTLPGDNPVEIKVLVSTDIPHAERDMRVDAQLNNIPLVLAQSEKNHPKYAELISTPKDESPHDREIIAAAQELAMDPRRTVEIGDRFFYPSLDDNPLREPLMATPGGNDVITVRVMEPARSIYRGFPFGAPVAETKTVDTYDDPNSLIGYFKIKAAERKTVEPSS